MQRFIAFLRDENGASAGEYALILAIIGAAVAASSVILAGNMRTGIETMGTCVKNSNGTGCPTAVAAS